MKYTSQLLYGKVGVRVVEGPLKIQPQRCKYRMNDKVVSCIFERILGTVTGRIAGFLAAALWVYLQGEAGF